MNESKVELLWINYGIKRENEEWEKITNWLGEKKNESNQKLAIIMVIKRIGNDGRNFIISEHR